MRTRGSRLCGVAAGTLLGFNGGLSSQQAGSPLPIEALLSAPTFTPPMAPVISPDGSLLAYGVTDNRRRPAVDEERSLRTGVSSHLLGSDIWITELGGGASRNLTAGQGNSWGQSWSPDGRRLAFLSDRPGRTRDAQTHLWIWERESGRIVQASDLPIRDPWVQLGRLEWLADSRTVLVKTYPENVSPVVFARSVMRASRAAPATADTAVSAQVFRFEPDEPDTADRSGPANLDILSGGLALVDVETGAVRRILGSARLCSYALSPNRRFLAWAVMTRFERAGSHQILVDVMNYDLESRQIRRLVSDAPLVYGYANFPVFTWSPASDAIAYRTNGKEIEDATYIVPSAGGPIRRVAGGVVSHEADVARYPLWHPSGGELFFLQDGAIWRAPTDGRGARVLANDPDRKLWMIEQEGRLWSPDGGRTTVVFTRSTSTKHGGLARVDLASGNTTQLLEEARWYPLNPAMPPAITPDGKAILYLVEDPRHPPNFWRAEGTGDPRPRQVTRLAEELTAHGGGAGRVIAWRSLDGDTLRGALIYPERYRAGTRYPLIVKVYGGFDISDEINRFGYGPGAIDNLRVYSSRGYAVLLAESRLQVGTPVLDLVGSIIPGIEKAIELGVADPTRVGITGHSYGGYNTLALITHSRRFKAAVMRAGVGSLLTAYGSLESDGTNYLLPWAERGQARMGGTPWQVRERYIENSPIFYLDRVETPLLIIHGGKDMAFFADEVFTGMRRLGKRVEYARYSGEGHYEGDWKWANQVDYLARVIRWFERHLKPVGNLSTGGEVSPAHQ